MEKVLKEWAPLTGLFNKLPSKVQNGIFTSDLKLTCVDVLPEFLVLGTNFGLVYWYDRKKKNIQKLRCENSTSCITAVKVISTVDFMVACGNKDGNVSIFQIPKNPAESLPESLKPKNKQIERYTVADLHKSPVSALEWSKNGMKLFSGDKSGHVVLTEIDFYMHICKSMEILNESYEIVQLNFYQQMLLVSTTYRSIICKKSDKWKVAQIGRKDRKILGSFGGIIRPNGLCPNDAVIYCTRPGLRIWESDLNGNVLKTLLFKDILTQSIPEIEVINPISETVRKKKPHREKSFGIILPFKEESLAIYNNDILFVLNPKTLTVEASLSNLRNILSVGVHKNEIFVLEGERSLIRLSYTPENCESDTSSIPTGNAFLPLTSSLRDLSLKLQSASIISAFPPLLESTDSNNFNIYTDLTTVTNAEEATESPENDSLYAEASSDNLTEKIKETYKKLERLDKAVNGVEKTNDSILYKHRKHKKNDVNLMADEYNVNDTNGVDEAIFKPTIMNISTVGILPDLRSPEAIKNDIENKEKLLADILYLNTVTIPEDALKRCESNEDVKDVLKSEKKEFKNKENKNGEIINSSVEDSNSIGNDSSILSCDSMSNTPANSLPKSIVSYLNKMNLPSKNVEHKQTSVEPLLKKEVNAIYESNNQKLTTKTPECVEIPYDWKLNSIQLKEDEELSDSSLKGWELL